MKEINYSIPYLIPVLGFHELKFNRNIIKAPFDSLSEGRRKDVTT